MRKTLSVTIIVTLLEGAKPRTEVGNFLDDTVKLITDSLDSVQYVLSTTAYDVTVIVEPQS